MGENNFLWLVYTLLYQNIKTNPWVNRFKRPAGPRVQPHFRRKYGFRIVNNSMSPLVIDTYDS